MLGSVQEFLVKDNITNIGFVGVGNLGRHAIFGLKDSFSIIASDPIQNEDIKKLGITYQTVEDLCKNSDVIFLTIKPNKAKEVLNKIKDLIEDKLVISFIAGMSLKNLKTLLSTTNVIRAMPSLGISNGVSPIAVCSVKKIENNIGMIILDKLGKCIEIDESKFDAFTSIFGAGPAYISYLGNLLSEIALSNGFEDPEPLIRELLGGTYEIHNSHSKPSFNEIKTMVASKGGVTEAALKKIESSGMEEIWKLAIEDAINQSKNLGDN